MSMYDSHSIFQQYLANTSEKPIFIEKFARYFKKEKHKEPMALLDVGCHNGTLTLGLLDAIQGYIPPDSTIHCIDPSETAIDQFKKSSLPSGIKFIFEVNKAEAFHSIPDIRYDWAILSHCLYWTRNLKETIAPILNHSKNAVIVLRGSRGIYQIQSKFKNLLGNIEEQLYTANDINSALQVLCCQFVRQDITSKIKLPKRNDPSFKVLVAFFLQTDLQALSEEQLEEVSDFLKTLGNPILHDVSFFWIHNR